MPTLVNPDVSGTDNDVREEQLLAYDRIKLSPTLVNPDVSGMDSEVRAEQPLA